MQDPGVKFDEMVSCSDDFMPRLRFRDVKEENNMAGIRIIYSRRLKKWKPNFVLAWAEFSTLTATTGLYEELLLRLNQRSLE